MRRKPGQDRGRVLVDHLELSGFVLMRRPPARNTTPLEPGGPRRLTE